MKDLLHHMSFCTIAILLLPACSIKSENAAVHRKIINNEETIYGTWIPGKVYLTHTGKDVTGEFVGYVFNFNHYKSQIDKINTDKWYQIGSWNNSSESLTGLFIDSRFNQRIRIEIPNYQPVPMNSILLTLSKVDDNESSELFTHMNGEGEYLIFINKKNASNENIKKLHSMTLLNKDITD